MNSLIADESLESRRAILFHKQAGSTCITHTLQYNTYTFAIVGLLYTRCYGLSLIVAPNNKVLLHIALLNSITFYLGFEINESTIINMDNFFEIITKEFNPAWLREWMNLNVLEIAFYWLN